MKADSGISLSGIKVDGGASANNYLMQTQADIIGAQVIRPKVTETTALGAAYLAGIAVGFWAGIDEVKQQWKAERIFVPSASESDVAAAKTGWADAISRTLSK
jgi:glycerol kinase